MKRKESASQLPVGGGEAPEMVVNNQIINVRNKKIQSNNPSLA